MGQLVFQATAGGQVALVGPNPATNFSINVPAITGTLVTTGDTGTVTSTMLATSVYTAPGTIGSVTPNTGAFTTLSASSTVSGAGFSTYLASPPAIGGTAPSTGKFTSITNTGLTSGRVVYSTTGGLEADSANLQFNGTNLGLNFLPSSWNSGYRVIDSSFGSFAIENTTVGQALVTQNAYNTGTATSPTWLYKSNGYAAAYIQNASNAGHQWFVSAVNNSGAGAALTFTQAMTLDNSGNLLVGTTTSPSGSGQINAPKGLTGTPTFSAYQNSNQSYSSSTSNLINFQAKNWDTASCFNNTGSTVGSIPAYAFLPNVAGYYQVNLIVRTNNTNQEAQATIYKNGAAWCNGSNINITSGTQSGTTASTIVYLNGTSDYIQAYVYTGSAGTGSGNNQSTQFSAIMVRGA